MNVAIKNISIAQSNIFLCNIVSLVCWKEEVHRHHHRRRYGQGDPQGPLGDPICDSPSTLVQSVMEFMRDKMGDQPEFILWTG